MPIKITTNGQPDRMYYPALFWMTFAIVIAVIVCIIMMISYRMKNGLVGGPTSDLTGFLKGAGADMRFAGRPDTGVPGGVVALSNFTGPEPPVYYNIGDVDGVRAAQAAAMAVPESYTEHFGLAPTVGGKQGFKMPWAKHGFDNPIIASRRWSSGGFTDQELSRRQ